MQAFSTGNNRHLLTAAVTLALLFTLADVAVHVWLDVSGAVPERSWWSVLLMELTAPGARELWTRALGAGLFVLFVAYVLYERRRTDLQLHYQASHDSLTGLPNRKAFLEQLASEVARAQRNNQKFALLVINLDNFKAVNDTLGHDDGDRLLLVAAQRLCFVPRQSDMLARIGGDEFVLLARDVHDPIAIMAVAERLLEAMSMPWDINGHPLQVTASIGIAVFPDDGADAQTLLRHVDIATHHAKAGGRNCYQFFAHDMNERAVARVHLESRLRRALERGEFELHYQPQVDLNTFRVIGAEALIRWRDAQGNPIPPMQFIPLAEETGLIVPIGEWVLRTACAQAVAWQQLGLPPMCIAVNVSGRQLRQNDFVAVVRSALRDTGLEPRWLELEITESLLMEKLEESIGKLKELRALGVRIAIDDFGTGYSSMNYLHRLPIDRLKIDRSFIQNITQNGDDPVVARAIIALGHALGLSIVAEGVETEVQSGFLRDQLCQTVQGFLYSRPLTVGQFEAHLATPPVHTPVVDIRPALH
ncbi:MAG TPA: EAL domain-containing protein [Acidiferrobacterales bacterium]|nr:EAL domain-containing protein [Acidiferrobacterales bacterium]